MRKPLIYTKHAEDAVDERRLSKDWIEATVEQPGWTEPDHHQSGVERRFRAIPEGGGRILRVACLETDQEVRILTAFFDRNARDPR